MFRYLGYPESVGKSTLDLFLVMVKNALDYDALVLLVDSCRRMNMQKMRKQASFTDDAVEKFRRGEIAQKELVSFCKERGLPLATKKDQQQLLGFINEARATALTSGVPPEQCGPEGSAAVDELSNAFREGVKAEQKGKLQGDPSKATLSINGIWSVLNKLGVTLTPIEKEEVKVKLFMDCGNVLDLSAFIRVVGWLAAAKQSSAEIQKH
eukprot:g6991.t1